MTIPKKSILASYVSFYHRITAFSSFTTAAPSVWLVISRSDFGHELPDLVRIVLLRPDVVVAQFQLGRVGHHLHAAVVPLRSLVQLVTCVVEHYFNSRKSI